MDLHYTDAQEACREDARAWLADHAPAPRSLPSLDTAEGFEAHRAWEAELAAEQAQAAVSRLGNDPKTQARLALALSGLARRHDKMDEAQRQVEHAVALLG